MRIKELADAAATTPRTVRHYHRLGLLAEPTRSANGYRQYTIADAVRLMRVRWLADSGVPLGSISSMLHPGPTSHTEPQSSTHRPDSSSSDTDLVEDLRALLAGVEEQQKVLQHKHSRLTSLLADAANGHAPSMLPLDLRAAFDAAAAETTTAGERSVLERDRDLLEVIAMKGAIPMEFFEALQDALTDKHLRARYLTLLRRWADIEGRNPEVNADRIQSLAVELAASLPLTTLSSFTTSADTRSTRPFVSLSEMVPDPAQRMVVHTAAEIIADRCKSDR